MGGVCVCVCVCVREREREREREESEREIKSVRMCVSVFVWCVNKYIYPYVTLQGLLVEN